MEKIIKGKNLEISDNLKSYIEKKFQKVDAHFHQGREIEIELTAEKNPSITNNQIVEVTIFNDGPLIRAKAASTDMHASIDLVLEKLERQLEEYKGRIYPSLKHHHDPEKYHPRIVKTKQYDVKSMTLQEAAVNMELLGHNFYIFKNAETDQISVVYHRKDKDIGLIEPM